MTSRAQNGGGMCTASLSWKKVFSSALSLLVCVRRKKEGRTFSSTKWSCRGHGHELQEESAIELHDETILKAKKAIRMQKTEVDFRKNLPSHCSHLEVAKELQTEYPEINKRCSMKTLPSNYRIYLLWSGENVICKNKKCHFFSTWWPFFPADCSFFRPTNATFMQVVFHFICNSNLQPSCKWPRTSPNFVRTKVSVPKQEYFIVIFCSASLPKICYEDTAYYSTTVGLGEVSEEFLLILQVYQLSRVYLCLKAKDVKCHFWRKIEIFQKNAQIEEVYI